MSERASVVSRATPWRGIMDLDLSHAGPSRAALTHTGYGGEQKKKG